MAEQEHSYGGITLVNARLLTQEEINTRYPSTNNSFVAKLTREFVERGFDILYGENPNLKDSKPGTYHNWTEDICRTAAHLYKTTPDRIVMGAYTDVSRRDAIFAAVKEK